MVIVKLIGGLGNQMFQYALGRALSEKYGTELKLDISGFNQYKLHSYSLNHFNISAKIASDEEIGKVKRNIQETSPRFDSKIMEAGGDVYLSGHWQTEKYFSSIKNIIRNEFVVVSKPIGEDLRIINDIKRCNSVSLHIRRADYLTNRDHGACGLEYYLKAISYISKKISNPVFYIFSDDYEWVRNNLKFDYPAEFIHHNNADKNYEDLRLMSSCKHNIIANSTFSWWGAWLNENKSKIVIAPKKWFGLNLEKNSNNLEFVEKIKAQVYKIHIFIKRLYGASIYSTKDLLPDEWVKI